MALPIPVSPVPISLTNLVLYFMVYILGMKGSLMSFGLYLLLGAAGLPVFSGFAGGLGKLAGPTGGYLLGFIFMTLAAGFMVERFPDRIFLHGIGMAVGTAICYLFGTVWLAEQMSLTFTAALGVGVIPYLPGDADEDPPGCDPWPEAQEGRKAHAIQMTVKEHKTGTSSVQEKGPGRFFFMAEWLLSLTQPPFSIIITLLPF